MELQIQWHGHACFQLSCGGYQLVFDPYQDHYVPGLAPLQLQAHEVLCSHGHEDHSAEALVARLPQRESPFRITAIPSWHDPEEGRLRGANTIHLLSCGAFRIAHFGDLGESLDERRLQLLEHLDVAMIPIGGCYTIDPTGARALIERLRPRIIFPMHYRSAHFGFDTLAKLEDFLALSHNYPVVYYPDPQRSVTKESPTEISLLRYRGLAEA